MVGKSGKAPHKQKALCKPQSEKGKIFGVEKELGCFLKDFVLKYILFWRVPTQSDTARRPLFEKT